MINKKWAFTLFILLLLLTTVLEFLTVFLKSHLTLNQELEGTLGLAHFLHNNIFHLRIVLLVILIGLAYSFFRKFKMWQKVVASIFILLYLGIFYLANYVAQVEIYFKDPENVILKNAKENTVPLETIILGAEVNGEARAYPLDYLTFHHKVSDEIGGEPVLVTYCLVCRSGRIFSSVIDGKEERFRLVGMVDYNAVIQDASSSSWWQQATGEAIYGKKTGTIMKEYFSEQMALSSWLDKYPKSLIFQPDTTYTSAYENYAGFATGYGEVNGRADSSWQRKSWVVGVVNEDEALAFDYTQLSEQRVLHDRLGDMPVVVALEPDTLSIHVWDTRVDSLELTFKMDLENQFITDTQTLSSWDRTGSCTEGELIGKKLTAVQAYVEYWHSWEEFHPDGKRSGVD
ncbi:MAG: DUF3179 domain-containing (seleno)protein [Bacteroidota bacterium]